MKKYILTFLGLSLLFSFSAKAEFYASTGLGFSKSNGSINSHGLKDSEIYSFAFGWQTPFWDVLRIEGEYLHNRPTSKNKGKLSMDGLMGNGYVSIPSLIPFITPYVGAGVGVSNLQDDKALMYQGMLGIDASIFSIPVVGSLEYRYLKANSSVKDNHLKYKYDSHSLMLKLRYEF